MSETLENLRFGYETKLFQAIEAEIGEQRGRDAEEAQDLLQMRRRSLLGDAVRITPELLPEVHAAYQECLDVLGGGLTGNLFVMQSSEYNASVLGHDKTFDVVVHSALLKDFSLPQLKFVFGHELGHVVFGHSKFNIHEILGNPDGVPAALASLLFKWSRAAEVSADRVGLMCCGQLTDAVSALFLTASGITGIDDDKVLRSLRGQYDELERHINEQKASHGWIRTHPMIPIRFKACELAALDITALRQSHRGFSWSGFRGIDTKIMNVLETLDKLVDFVPGAGPGGMGGASLRGPRDEDTQLAVFLSLLHVALADGKIQWNERAFLTDLSMALGTRLPIKHMMDAAESSGRDFGRNAIGEIQERREQFQPDDVRKVLELAAVMICQHGRVKRPEQRAMEEVATALGANARLVNEVVMFVQMNGPTQQKVLEGW